MASREIRQTSQADRATVDRLLSIAVRKHLHLDWLDPAELTGKRPFLLALEGQQPVACLAAPPDTPGVAWLRAFALASDQAPQPTWEALWEAARSRLRDQKVTQVAAMALDGWFAKLLRRSGFDQTNSVVFFELDLVGARNGEWDPDPAGRESDTTRPLPSSRPITGSDLQPVLELDSSAFDPLWRLSPESMRAALRLASSATMIEMDGVAAGYQITTSSPFSVHLARLAVRPDWHRRGLGRRLVQDSIRVASGMPLGRLSVNTQADNTASQSLYRRLGFKATGQNFPVYTSLIDRE